MTWQAGLTEPSTVHVTPVDDWIEHEDSADCICGPRVTVTARSGVVHPVDGGLSATVELVHIVTHASLDGRELDEVNYRG